MRGRIDTYLSRADHASTERVRAGVGTLVVRQASHEGVTVGAFAATKRELKNNPNYFIEVPIPGQIGETALRKQLWLPAAPWRNLREITATEAERSARFEAWPAAQQALHDVAGYSLNDPANQALVKEAQKALVSIGAIDSGLTAVVVRQ